MGSNVRLSNTNRRSPFAHRLVIFDWILMHDDVPIGVIPTKEVDVSGLVDTPVILHHRVGILCRSEHQIGEKPCGTSVSVNEWVDPDCLGMGDNTQFMWRPVVGVLPSIEDRVQRIAEVDSNLLVWNADVDVTRPPFACPGPNIAV